mmetsp:Transcript_49242/g.126977  ORF Transcript_49242/g.126977 Transcript_49242/m.126977 type:complete len:303 (+) Transcript_49242:173-1081(+)
MPPLSDAVWTFGMRRPGSGTHDILHDGNPSRIESTSMLYWICSCVSVWTSPGYFRSSRPALLMASSSACGWSLKLQKRFRCSSITSVALQVGRCWRLHSHSHWRTSQLSCFSFSRASRLAGAEKVEASPLVSAFMMPRRSFGTERSSSDPLHACRQSATKLLVWSVTNSSRMTWHAAFRSWTWASLTLSGSVASGPTHRVSMPGMFFTRSWICAVSSWSAFSFCLRLAAFAASGAAMTTSRTTPLPWETSIATLSVGTVASLEMARVTAALNCESEFSFCKRADEQSSNCSERVTAFCFQSW